jgi:acid phosphatase type 7
VIESKDGKGQIKWMDDVLTKNNLKTIVGYHTSFYPRFDEFEITKSSVNNLKWNSDLLVSSWGPIFDQFNVSIALENHYHNYHRTFKIYENKISQKGTIYVGGGLFLVILIKFRQLGCFSKH